MKYILLISIFLFSCSAEQRIARIVKRHPELLKHDTIFKKDTIIVKEVSKDTTFFYNTPDTVTITQDKLEIKYFYNTKDSTVYIKGKCKTDTIYKSYPIYVSKLAVAKKLTFKQRIKLWIFDNIWWLVLVLIILVYLFRKVILTYFPFLNILKR